MFDERTLEAAIANKRFRAVQLCEDPHVTAGLFKQFFLQLPEPLVAFGTY